MGRLVPALARGMDILELFLEVQGSLSVPEIVTSTGLPRATVHGLVSTLVEREYLQRRPGDSGRLSLGVRVFQLGSVYRDGLDLAREGHAVAAEVAAACDETVNVAVLDGTDSIYIATVPSTHSVRMVTGVGRRVPSHCTALGKVMLASLSDEAFDARYPANSQLAALTPSTITSVAGLKKQIAHIRSEGLAHEFGEANDAVTCVAAPIWGDDASVVAALSIAVPILRWSDEREPELKKLVLDGAAQLSRRLGYPGPEMAVQSAEAG